jgi:hypothetical protein
MDVLSIGSTTSSAHVNRDTTLVGGVCSAPSVNGCLLTTATRSISSLGVGAVPSALKPIGAFGSLVELTGYSDAVTVQSGITTTAPSASMTGGTIRWWNGIGYTLPVALSTLSGTTINSSLNVTSGIVNIVMSASLRVGSSTKSSTTGMCIGGTVACVKRADAAQSSPLRGTVTYDIRVLGVSKLAFTVALDLGDITATTTYSEP